MAKNGYCSTTLLSCVTPTPAMAVMTSPFSMEPIIPVQDPLPALIPQTPLSFGLTYLKDFDKPEVATIWMGFYSGVKLSA